MTNIQAFSKEKQDVLNRIGYSDTDTVSARIDSLVDDYLDNYHEFIAPSFTYVHQSIKAVGGNIIQVGTVALKSTLLARLLERCEQVAVFALTIGGYLEELVAYLSENGLVLQATVLDAVGSGAAEILASGIEADIRRIVARRGRVISRRFSPGYCDWDITQQSKLFQLLDGEEIDITLTESGLMVPRKSISGVIGIGLPGRGITEYNPCVSCQKKDCPGRRR